MLAKQIDLWDDQIVVPSLINSIAQKNASNDSLTYFSAPTVDLSIYDHIIVSMSGGKDSIAALLEILDMGADKSKIELWHNAVDGRGGKPFMDWMFMDDYNIKIAEHFGIPLYFSWLEHGFKGEMLKKDSYSHPHKVETPEGLITLERERAKIGTRLKFPQQSPSLQTRWCSSALKIDVARRALNNQDRFHGKKILFITGERREESANRSRYNQLEAHACDTRNGRLGRHVDAWRTVLHWSEEQVWAKLEEHGFNAPVPYRLGWNRSSCMTCIYNGPTIWATLFEYFPDRAKQILEYEKEFNTTISRKRLNVFEISENVRPFEVTDLEALEQALSSEYTLPIITSDWKMPKGAFGSEGCGAV
jgi:3'-phosphoadenosine 5'-phosphosulfate sulfotransferase (PAPS reductase)/FAD synthetase